MSERTRSSPHWQGLDGLRALAVVAVVVYHFWPGRLPGGFLGVDVFFVVSGYLITRLLTTEFLDRRRLAIGRFYGRRARRLLPALALLLASVAVAALVWRDQLATMRTGVLATAVFGGNWWLAFDHQSYFVASGRPSMLQHLWSLGVEEQFYLFWPLLVGSSLAAGRRSAARRGGSPRRVVVNLVALSITLAFVSTALMWWLADRRGVPYGDDGSSLYFGTDTHCMGLLLGAALGAWAAVVREPAIPRWTQHVGDAAGLAALAGLALFAFRLADYSMSLYRGDFLAVSALVVVVIAVVTQPASRLGAVLEARWLRWVGVRSYGIYLWHWPIAVVTRPGIDTSLPVWSVQTLRVVLTLGIAALSYRYLEQPVRRYGPGRCLRAVVTQVRRHWRALPPRPVVAWPVALAGLVVAGLVVVVAGPAAPRPSAAAGVGTGGRHLALHDRQARPPDPARPNPKRRPGLPKISGFGDSVLLGARHTLAAEFAGGSIDAVEGRQPDPILADARAMARDGRVHPLVILHLGNNGLINPSDLRRTLAALHRARLVVVFNDHVDPYDRSWQKPNNATISDVVPEYSNAVVINWDRLAGAHPAWLYRDDIHLRPPGAVAYARLVKSSYEQFLHRESPSA